MVPQRYAFRFVRLLLGAAGAAVLLTGCAVRDKDAPPLRTATRPLTIAHMDEPRRLDPAHIKDLYEGMVSGLIYEGLVRFGSGPEIEPGLAESWTVSEDGLDYLFRLREAEFHDGRPVRAADAVYSLTRILWPETMSDRKWVADKIAGAEDVMAGRTRGLAGVRALDDRTLSVTLARAYPPFLIMLAMPTGSIIPEDSAPEGGTSPGAFDRAPVGAGPWRLDSWQHDRALNFRRHDGYYRGAAVLEQLQYLVQQDDTVRRRLFESGQIDIYQVSFTVYGAWASDPAWRERFLPVQELRTDYVGIMQAKEYLQDRAVRQFLFHAIGRERIFRDLQKGRGVLAHGPVPPGIPGYRAEGSADAGATTGPAALPAPLPALELWYREEALNAEIVKAVAEDLAEAGVTVRLVPRDQASFRQGVWDGQPDLFLSSWTLDYPDIENALVPPFHSRNIPRQGNSSRTNNPDIDAALERAETEADAARRIELFAEAEGLVADHMPWIWLFHRRMDYVVRPRIEGFRPALMYNADRYHDVRRLSAD